MLKIKQKKLLCNFYFYKIINYIKLCKLKILNYNNCGNTNDFYDELFTKESDIRYFYITGKIIKRDNKSINYFLRIKIYIESEKFH